MASIADQILIKMGLDSSQLEAGLNRSKQQIGATTQAMDKMGAKWASTAKMLTTTILAPVAGFMSLGAVIKSYFGGVAQVAQMTGAYNTKMEEWRKKRAMLARYNKEDIELYKKGREAVVKFQITMDDLSAKIMRSVSPAVKWLIDKLNDFSDWIDRNSQNIIRFLGVVAGTITALLIPSFIKLGIAMLTNPLTWIIALLGILILIIDDLVTYLRGGDSALGAFWKPLIEYTKIAWEWIKKLYDAFVNSEAWQAFKNAYVGIFSHLFNGIKQLWNLITEFIATLTSSDTKLSGWVQAIKGIFTTIGGAFESIIGSIMVAWGALIAVFTGDTSVLENAWVVLCDGLKTTFNGVKNTFLGIVQVIKDNFNGLVDTVSNTLLGIVQVIKDNFNGLVDTVSNTFSGIIQVVNDKFNGLLDTVNGLVDTVSNTFSGIIQVVNDKFNGLVDTVSNTFSGIFQVIKDNFNSLLDTVNSLIDAILNFGSAIVKALNIDALIDKVKAKLAGILPDWVKSTLGINEDGKKTEQPADINEDGKKTEQPTIHEGTDAPIVPDVESMQSMKAQSKSNINNNINRSQVINIESNNPAVATATMREADYEMNNADRAIAMASQGAGW